MRKQKLFLLASIAALAVAAWLNVQPIHSQVIGGGSSVIGGGNAALAVAARVYNVKTYGATGNGTTDDSTAVNAAILACHTAGGGTVYFPAGTYKMLDNPLTIPTLSSDNWVVAGGRVKRMNSMRITGDNPDCSPWSVAAVPSGGTVIDLQYAQSPAKVICLGAGLLEVDHISFLDTVEGASPFFFTTNTILRVHDCLIYGKTSGAYNTTAAQNGFIFGGETGRQNYRFTVTAPAVAPTVGDTYTNNSATFTLERIVNATTYEFSTPLPGAPEASGNLVKATGSGSTPIAFSANSDVGAISGGATTDWFQGYGTVIERNAFHKIGRMAYFRYGANSIIWKENYNDMTCGADAAIEILGSSDWNANLGPGANIIRDNLVEMWSYKYGVKLNYCKQNVIHGNQFWDMDQSHTPRCVYLAANAKQNHITGNHDDDRPTYFYTDLGTDNTFHEYSYSQVKDITITGDARLGTSNTDIVSVGLDGGISMNGSVAEGGGGTIAFNSIFASTVSYLDALNKPGFLIQQATPTTGNLSIYWAAAAGVGGSQTWTESMHFEGDGKVVIGATTIDTALTVKDITINQATGTNGPYYNLKRGGSLKGYVGLFGANPDTYVNASAGHIFLSHGTGKTINVGTLPTSASGLASGDLWSDSGTVKVVP